MQSRMKWHTKAVTYSRKFFITFATGYGDEGKMFDGSESWQI